MHLFKIPLFCFVLFCFVRALIPGGGAIMGDIHKYGCGEALRGSQGRRRGGLCVSLGKLHLNCPCDTVNRSSNYSLACNRNTKVNSGLLSEHIVYNLNMYTNILHINHTRF